MDTSNASSAKSKTSASASSSSINGLGLGPQNKHILSQDISSVNVNVAAQDEKNETPLSAAAATVLTVVGQTMAKSTAPLAVLHLPPPTATALVQASANISELGSMPRARPSFVSNTSTTEGKPMAVASMPSESASSSEPSCPVAVSMAPSACDFDSDTELSIVAAAAAVSAAAGIDSRSPTSPPPSAASTIMPALGSGGGGTAASLSTMAGSQGGFGAGSGVVAGNTNGHSTSSSSTHLSLNAKQQRQQKRRRERAQRLQAERDSRCNSSSLSGTFIAGSVGVSAISAANVNAAGGQGSLVTPNGGNSSVAIGNGSVAGPGNGMIYHINSAGSMGEDSNNSNGNFTSSSNGSNNLLPPTDSIASLLLNPPHSPECNSGLMATPSDSEGESLDEDLLSTSSSSTLLLPRDKPPPRPPPPVRRKLPRSPVLEEEIIDGFAILEFKTYEDLEFAIKLGQKRKEKRLSALDELTCTYSIEEMKIPKVIDTGQSQPLRVTNLSTLTVNNNNLKENPHPHPQPLHRGGNVISNNNITSNGPSANSNNNSSITNVVYLLPSVNIGTVLETETEPRDHWRSEYGQQQDQLQSDNSANSKSNIISDDNQINNSSHQINHSNQSNKQAEGGCNAAKMQVNSATSTRFLENDNDSLMLDISQPSLGVGGAVSHSHDHIDVGMIHTSCTGSDTKKSHNSPATSNTIDQLHVTKSLPSLQLNNLISSDLTATANANNNHLGVCKLGSQSAQVVKKSNGLENIETVTTSATCRSLEIQELPNVPAQAFGASSSIKKENEQSDLLNDASINCTSTSKGNNICDNVSNDKKNSEQMFDIDNTPTPMNVSNTSMCQDRSTSRKLSDLPHLKKKSAACGDNSTFSGVPFTSSLSSVSAGNPESDASKALNIKNTSESTQGKVVHAGASVPTSPANVGESGNRELGMLQKSSSDKALYPSMCVTPSVSSVQFPNVGVSAGNEKIVSTVASDIDQKIIFNTKTTVSNGLSSGVQRSIVPLLSAAQSPATATLSSPFSAHMATPNAGLSILSSASSVILASSIKSNDNFARSNNNSSNNNNGSSNSQGTLSSVGLSSSSEITKNSSVSTSSPPNPIVNGFLSVYPPATIATSSVATSTLPRVSPNATNKLVAPVSTSISINTNYVGISGGTTTTSGMGKVVFGTGGNAIVGTGSPLLFPGAPPAPISHVASGVPMIIQAPPYRAPYTNYPLYTPYSGLTHGSYLPPVLPVATSNIPPTQIRSSDSRNSRESPASLKATSSNIALNVSMTPTLRSITPLNNSCAISSGASQPVVSVVPSANTTALSLSNSHISHSHHVPVYATGAFSSATAGTSTPNSGLSTLAVTSLSTSAAPQPHFPQSTQMHSQSGNFSSVSHLLTTHSMPPQNQPLVRCGSALYSSSASAVAASSNFSPSVLAVQSLTTAVTSSSSSPSTSSSSVIQKVISPKGESPCNKDRDPSYSTNIRSHGASTILPVVSQGISLGSSFCGIPPSQYGGTGTSVLSSSSSMTGLGNLPSYSSKAALWLNSPANAVVTSCASSTPIVSSGSARPTPPLSNCTSMGIGMVNSAPTARSSCNAISPLSIPATAGIHVSATNPSFQSSSYFPTPLAPPPSSPSPATSSAAIISSASPFPAVSHSMSSIVTTAGAPTTTASSITQPTAPAISNTVTSTPHPFSAESLFQPSKNDQADLLRRELDSRFLDRSGLAVTPTPPSSTYLRTDLQHQQHPHLHQHPQLLPPASASSTPLTAVQPTSGQIFPPPLFKDLSKISSVDPQFYRAGMGLPTAGYSGYTSAGLLHSGLGGPTPFMPPNHLTSFAPKKTGRWNAMHVRIAWEIYYHQNKQSSEKTGFPTASSNAQSINAPIPPGNLISGGGGMASGANTPVNNVAAIPAVGGGVLVSNGPASVLGIKTTPQLGLNTAPQHILHRANELPPSAAFANALPGRLAFETSNLTASFIGAPPSHIGTAVSPFGRYVNPFGFTGLTHFGGHLDSWRSNAMQRSVAAYHPSTASASPNWPVKTDPGLDNARREAEERERELRDREQRERDRQRREREERERKEKEEKLKREQQERERERERDRKERERERREIERREMERERMLQQQRINESNKQAAAVHAAAAVAAPVRDRSPHRNVGELNTEIRIKEEHPRTKDEQDVMLLRASAAAVGVGDPRYHSSSLAAAQANAAAAAAHHHHANFMAASRHGLPPPSHLTRTMMPPTLSVGGPMAHFGAPAPPGWGIDPYRDPYPMLRYNPIMEAALRHEAEERQKAINIYAAQSAAHLRSKEPSPIPPSVGSLGPPPPHHRLQIVTGGVVGPSGVQQQQQGQQPPQLSSGGGIGKNSGPPAPVSIPVQHMISVDSMSQQTVTAKKEADHTMGIVTNAGVGLGTVPGGVIGISPVSSVAPSR